MLVELLKALKMPGAINALPGLASCRDRDSYLKAILKAEIQDRQDRTVKRRLTQAQFPLPKE